MSDLTAAIQTAAPDVVVDDEGGTNPVIDVNDAEIAVCRRVLPLLRQRQHHAVIV